MNEQRPDFTQLDNSALLEYHKVLKDKLTDLAAARNVDGYSDTHMEFIRVENELTDRIHVLREQALDTMERQLYRYRKELKQRTDVGSEEYRDLQRAIDSLEWTFKRDGIEVLPDEPLTD